MHYMRTCVRFSDVANLIIYILYFIVMGGNSRGLPVVSRAFAVP